MSQKELCIQLLERVPEFKLGYVIAYLQGITADESADDAYCQKLYEDYLGDSDSEKDTVFPLEACKKEWGLA